MQMIKFQSSQEQAPVYGVALQGQVKQASDQVGKSGNGNAVQMPDALAKRQALAKKQAHKIVSDAFAGEKKIDADVQGLNDQTDTLRRDNLAAGEDISKRRALMDEAKEQHGIARGSAEERELELWQKGESLEGRASMSDDERKAYAELKKRGLTQSQQDYLDHVGDIDEQIKLLERQMSSNDAQIQANNAAVAAIGIERLKSDPMGEAQEEAEGALRTAKTKARTYQTFDDIKPSPPYNVGDMWILTYMDDGGNRIRELYTCVMAKKEEEEFERTGDELDAAGRELKRVLEAMDIDAVNFWAIQTRALIDRREMVEVRHHMVEQRQRIRTHMERQIVDIRNERENLLLLTDGQVVANPEMRNILDAVNKFCEEFA